MNNSARDDRGKFCADDRPIDKVMHMKNMMNTYYYEFQGHFIKYNAQ